MNITVDGKRIKTNRHGVPYIASFLKHFFEKEQVKSVVSQYFNYTDTLDNLEETVKRVSHILGVRPPLIWSRIATASPPSSKTRTPVPIKRLHKQGKVGGRGRGRKRALVFDAEEEEDEADPIQDYVEEDYVEEEEDIEDEEDPIINSDDDELPPTPPPARVRAAPVVAKGTSGGRAITFDEHVQMVNANAAALRALTSTLSMLEVGIDDDLIRYTKATMASYARALDRNGPIVNPAALRHPVVQPELEHEARFGVSERIRHLRIPNGDRLDVGAIGKRALQYYKERYPGCVPPQTLVRAGEGRDRIYLMNLYTETTAPLTLDRAIREQRDQ